MSESKEVLRPATSGDACWTPNAAWCSSMASTSGRLVFLNGLFDGFQAHADGKTKIPMFIRNKDECSACALHALRRYAGHVIPWSKDEEVRRRISGLSS